MGWQSVAETLTLALLVRGSQLSGGCGGSTGGTTGTTGTALDEAPVKVFAGVHGPEQLVESPR